MNDGENRSEVGPVNHFISVVLMIAITVILATTIAVFVLGLGEQIGDINQQSPSADFDIDFVEDKIILTHVGGDELDKNNLMVRNGKLVYADDKVNVDDEIHIKPKKESDIIELIWVEETSAKMLESIDYQ